jgi:hypothetical protein
MGDVSASPAQIYVRLLDEGVEVWRPTEARQESDGAFTILGPSPAPPSENWEFSVGTRVRCQPHEFSGGVEGLVAVALAE